MIDPIILRDLCYEIESSQSSAETAEECAEYLVLPWGSMNREASRRKRIGLFVGRKGQHIQATENTYNVRVRIVTPSSSKPIRKQLNELLLSKNMEETNHNLYLLLTKMDTLIKDKILFDEIKQILTDKWNAIV